MSSFPPANAQVIVKASMTSDGNAILTPWTYWSTTTGHITLLDALTRSGCDFSGWSQLLAADISGDGRTLVGNGINPQGVQEAWIATIPAPGVVVSLALAGLMATRRRR